MRWQTNLCTENLTDSKGPFPGHMPSGCLGPCEWVDSRRVAASGGRMAKRAAVADFRRSERFSCEESCL